MNSGRVASLAKGEEGTTRDACVVLDQCRYVAELHL